MVERLVAIAHATLDGSPHCTGFEAVQMGRSLDDPERHLNSDGAYGNPAFIQDVTHPWVDRLQEWTGLAPEVVTYGTNATHAAEG